MRDADESETANGDQQIKDRASSTHVYRRRRQHAKEVSSVHTSMMAQALNSRSTVLGAVSELVVENEVKSGSNLSDSSTTTMGSNRAKSRAQKNDGRQSQKQKKTSKQAKREEANTCPNTQATNTDSGVSQGNKVLEAVAKGLLRFDPVDETEKPMCPICQELPVKPVVLPCRCRKQSPICFKEWEDYYEKYGSKCPICSMGISRTLLRRVGGMESFVHTNLWEYIQLKFTAELEQQLSQGLETAKAESSPSSLLPKNVIAPKQGELLADLRNLESRYNEIRQNEAAENERKLEEFLRTEGLENEANRLRQQQEDEQIAVRLQSKLNSVKSITPEKMASMRISHGEPQLITIDIASSDDEVDNDDIAAILSPLTATSCKKNSTRAPPPSASTSTPQLTGAVSSSNSSSSSSNSNDVNLIAPNDASSAGNNSLQTRPNKRPRRETNHRQTFRLDVVGNACKKSDPGGFNEDTNANENNIVHERGLMGNTNRRRNRIRQGYLDNASPHSSSEKVLKNYNGRQRATSQLSDDSDLSSDSNSSISS